jgi:hypothetical protein
MDAPKLSQSLSQYNEDRVRSHRARKALKAAARIVTPNVAGLRRIKGIDHFDTVGSGCQQWQRVRHMTIGRMARCFVLVQ